ncbi:MAG: transposase [Phaeodactylibacter sp.]|nr:transposase [Phaeodactylibacter sp.]
MAISNHRIANIDKQRVFFRYKDYRKEGKRKTMSLAGVEFLRRFCLHILPPGFRRMRHYGILSNFHKARALHDAKLALRVGPAKPVQKPEPTAQREKVLEQWLGRNPHDCTHCGAKGTIQRVAIIPASCRDPPTSAIQAAQFF